MIGRLGLDGSNIRIISLVHPVNRNNVLSATQADVNLFYLNAFYCQECGADGNGIMVFGEGLPDTLAVSGSRVNFWAGALDIVAHELTHGLTFFTSKLSNRNTPGALNEAFSDILGTATEFFHQAPGVGPLKADYLIAEDIITPLLAGLNRSIADPQRFGDPDHLSKRVVGSADNGGVHTNSTIASHTFYLAVEGGTNRTSGVAVQGVGNAMINKMAEIYFRAFTSMLTSNASYQQARAATIQSARDLDPSGAFATAIAQAWTAVGVN